MFRLNWSRLVKGGKAVEPPVYTNHASYREPYEVYEMVARILGCTDLSRIDEETHMTAADAEGWCEIPGSNTYEDPEKRFTIEIVD